MDVDQKIQLAFQHFDSGNFQQATDICKKILEKEPHNITVLHFLGVIYYRLEDYGSAIKYLRKAIQFDPYSYEGFYNLGRVFQSTGQIDEAIGCYQRVIGLKPDFIDAYMNLGNAFRDAGKLDEAIACYQKIVGSDPANAGAYFHLGAAFQNKGQIDAAIASYQKALELNLHTFGIYNNLGLALQDKGDTERAITCFQKALELGPNFIDAHYNLGIAFYHKGQFDSAMSRFQKALSINPNFAYAYNAMGAVLKDRGKYDESELHLKHALQLNPAFSIAYSNLLLYMNYSSRHDAQSIFTEHLRFAQQMAGPLSADILPHTNEPSLSRRLKIGYVSPDFRRHSVNYFIEPVLASHDHDRFEVFCYSNVAIADNTTERMRGYRGRWRDIRGMPDEKAAELIRKDAIDILVDLAGHTGHNRLLVFARKPAPVQVSWIGYPNTTGLSTIDYRIVDRYTDPQGLTDQFHTEKLLRLPECFLCYLPDKDSPAVGELPASKSGHITLGSFNAFPKLSQEIAALWAAILRELPDCRLVMKAKSFSDSMAREYAMEMFKAHGISPDRVELVAHMSSFTDHLDLYNRVDIALDTFPYNGTTTTCEALWMGVPVITLAGGTHASRVGTTILTNVGLPRLIARKPDEYVKIALDLAKDVGSLKSMRRGLREMIKNSPLTDAKRFTVNLENCYRIMWERWYKSH